MECEDARTRCLSLPGATSDYPFGPGVEVFRVGGKLFALLAEEDGRLSLKCDPGLAEILRQAFPGVIPGYHLNKRHWNTVALDGSVPDGQVEEMISHSYELVFGSLPRRVRSEIRPESAP